MPPLANDLIQSGETPVLEVTAQPAHGQLTQNGDGTFSYQPDSDATIMAGKPLTLDLLAGAHDVENDPLSARFLTVPAHGTLEQNPDGTWPTSLTSATTSSPTRSATAKPNRPGHRPHRRHPRQHRPGRP